jgi:GNAT superfamily N-acetyltransferase
VPAPAPSFRAHISPPAVREATPDDRPEIRRTILAAYQPYAEVLQPRVFDRYLADLLDLGTHARRGRLLVGDVDGRVAGYVAFYPDISVQGVGWPVGWAGGRGLAVRTGAAGRGVARALVAECERRGRALGSPAFAFHTASFMTRARALYDGLGYQRAPEFDLDLAAHFAGSGGPPELAIAYRRDLTDTDRRTTR